MTYKKNYKIKGKFISKNDITNMILNVLDKFSKNDNLTVKIEAEFSDGTSISDNNTVIFDHVYFEKLLLERINVYIDYKYKDEVFLVLNRKGIYSYASIQSSDKTIYNSLCHSLEESLNLMKNQNKICFLPGYIWGYFLVFAISILIEILILLIIGILFKIKIPHIIIFLMLLILPSIISSYTINCIERNYPINQFYFGESSINKPKREKGFIYKFIMFIITNIILPILISIFIN